MGLYATQMALGEELQAELEEFLNSNGGAPLNLDTVVRFMPLLQRICDTAVGHIETGNFLRAGLCLFMLSEHYETIMNWCHCMTDITELRAVTESIKEEVEDKRGLD